VYAAGQCCAFARVNSDETLIVVLNAADESALIELPIGPICAVGTVLSPVFGDAHVGGWQDGQLTVSQPPRSGSVLAAK
jgi:hypothetical protein